MAFNLAQDVILKGVGSGLLTSVNGTMLEVLEGQNFKSDITSTLVDVEGGDGLFPIYTFISKKEGTVEIDSATFSLAQAPILQPAKITNDATVLRNRRFLITKTSTNLSSTETLTGVTNVSILSHIDGSVVTCAQTVPATPDPDTIYVTATGAVTFGSGVPAGEYAVWCQVPAVNGASAEFLKDKMPDVCSVNWMIPVVEDTAGNKYQFDFYARRMRPDGKMSYDTSKGKAAVPKMTFKILDPGDGYDGFCKVTLSKIG